MFPRMNAQLLWPFFLLGSVSGDDNSLFDAELHFKQKCSICHEGQELQRGPNLFGIKSGYLELQMKAFQAGTRGTNPKNKSEALMGSASSHLPKNFNRRALALWLSRQIPPPKVTNIKGDGRSAAAMVQTCNDCHQQEAVLAPRLDTLEPWYMLDQLRKFKSGLRGSNEDDHGGKVMQSAVKGMSDSDLKKIVIVFQEQIKEKRAK